MTCLENCQVEAPFSLGIRSLIGIKVRAFAEGAPGFEILKILLLKEEVYVESGAVESGAVAGGAIVSIMVRFHFISKWAPLTAYANLAIVS